MDGNLKTHSGQSMGKTSVSHDNKPTGIARVAALARTQPSMKFNNLMHHLTPELIKECIHAIPNGSASGVDGMSKDQVLENLNWLIPPALKAMHSGTYQAPPVRRVFIPKPDGRQRPIGVPTTFDKGCQAGIARILEGIYEQDFLNCSFGFRPGRGCHNALATIHDGLFKGPTKDQLNYALEVDIRDFFGSLDHGWLKKFLRHRISDERVIGLIESWLTAGVLNDGQYTKTDVGSPQGGSISPLLANIYLHYILDLWWEKRIKPRLRGKAILVRYCDDFGILCQNQDEAEGMLPLIKARFAQFNLQIAEEKTHLTDLSLRKSGGDKSRRRIDFLGFSIFRAKPRNGKGSKIVFKTEKSRFTRAKLKLKERIKKNRHLPISVQIRSINLILRGHFNYYGLPGNVERLRYYKTTATRYLRIALGRRSQNGLMSWERFQREVINVFKFEQPKLRVTYHEISDLAMS